MDSEERTKMRMPFGKHKGCAIGDLPFEYLEWLTTIELRDRLAAAVKANTRSMIFFRSKSHEHVNVRSSRNRSRRAVQSIKDIIEYVGVL